MDISDNNINNINAIDSSDIARSMPPQRFTQMAVVCYLSLTLVAIGWISLREGEVLPGKYLFGNGLIRWQIGIGVCFAMVFVAISWLGHLCFEFIRRAECDIQTLLGELPVSHILVLACCSSIGEEALFRGALQPTLGIWLTSAIFGVLHFPPTANLAFYPLLAALAGYGLGWLFDLTGGGLIAPIVAHFFINLVGLYRIAHLKNSTVEQNPEAR